MIELGSMHLTHYRMDMYCLDDYVSNYCSKQLSEILDSGPGI